MSYEVSGRRQRAQLENYRTDENLRRRASLFEYAIAPLSPQPMLWDVFPWSDGQTLLDLGCGNGMWIGALAGRVPQGLVVGVDVSTGMLTALGERHPSVPRVCGDGQALPLRDQAVDGVIAAWMLYHVPDKRTLLDEIRRVLRAGGCLIAATNSEVGVPQLDDAIGKALEATLGRTVERWIEPLDFTLENGEQVLRRAFASVDRTISETQFEVPHVEPLLAFVDSIRDPMQAELGAFDYDAFRAALEQRLTTTLGRSPLRFTRRTAFFVACDT
jgi:ubiquinone/menaquinone biosynthesis C-methylase UbiE